MEMVPEPMLGLTIWRFVFLLIFPFLLCFLSLRKVNKLSGSSALGGAVLLVLAGGTFVLGRADAVTSMAKPPGVILLLVTAAVLPTLGVYCLMFIQKWSGSTRTTQESRPGGAGLAAWLTPWRLLWAGALALALLHWADVPLLIGLLLLVGALAAYPLWMAVELGEAVPPVATPAAPVDDLSAEREKVLSMVAEKQITAEEGADLLNALAATQVRSAAPARVPLPRETRLVLLGAMLVGVGFFVPWFSINAGQELNRMTRSTGVTMNISGMPKGFQDHFRNLGSTVNVKTPTVRVAGAKIGDGLGWLILLMAGVVAAAQLFREQLDARTRHLVSVVALAVGGFLLLYLLSDTIRYIWVGMVIVLAGYGAMGIGLLRKPRQRLAEVTQAVPTV